jgi:hypothetical protein
MTRVEREQMIARYLGGEMTAAEEQEFFIRVAVDKELRHDLRAQRTVDSALQKDRDAEATGHTPMRMRVASVLAATPADVPMTADPASPPLATAAAATGAATKWIAGLAIGAIATAALVLLPGEPDQGSAIRGAGGARTDTIGPRTSAPMLQAPERSPAADVARVDTATTLGDATPDAAAHENGTAPELATTPLRRGTTERPRRTQREERGTTDTAESATSEESFERNDGERADDSINVGIKLQIPK